jgi:hypothetical protein
MIPVLAQVYSGARDAIGDTEVAAGQMWTDARLQEHYNRAYALLYHMLSLHDSKLLRRTAYFNLPAYQTLLMPAQMGITNLGEPKDIWARIVDKEYAVTGATPHGTSFYLDLSIAPVTHALADGAPIIVYGVKGISDDLNGVEWNITVPSTSSFRLLGCGAVGTWISGGTITTSSEAWPARPMTPWRDIQDYSVIGDISDGVTDRWAWVNGAFRFQNLPTKRQLRLIYSLSGTPPTAATDSMGVDDCLNFLVHYTAGGAAASKGLAQTAANLYIKAVGNAAGEAGDGGGGMLGQIVKKEVKAQQKVQRTCLVRWRPKRNCGTLNRY